jgi:serine/threonine protein phosphatase 1
MRTLAVGDVHGCLAQLDALLAAVAPTPADVLVFLGDYVDRGPDSRGVLDRLIALRETHRVVCLRGNHELMMVRARESRDERKMWLQVGGAECLRSYGPKPSRSGTLDDVPEAHWRFLLHDCVNWYETAAHVFVHAGLAPGAPLDQQYERHLFWEFLNPAMPFAHVGGKRVVCGHSSQRSGLPLVAGDTVCIDTYAYGGGPLTCLDVGSERYWQADLLGRVRTGTLPPRTPRPVEPGA